MHAPPTRRHRSVHGPAPRGTVLGAALLLTIAAIAASATTSTAPVSTDGPSAPSSSRVAHGATAAVAVPAPPPSRAAPPTTKSEPVPPAAAPIEPARSLGWMVGRWRGTAGESTIEELWAAPLGSTMLGLGIMSREGNEVFVEYLRIEGGPDGIVYLASPAGRQPPTAFRMTAADPAAATARFENPGHDFPQIIEYRRRGNVLTAHLTGVEQEHPRTLDMRWELVEGAGGETGGKRSAPPAVETGPDAP